MTQIIKTLYNFDLNIQYNNNFEYRNCLRQLFFMDYKLPDNLKDIDAETQDEYNYDEECISSTMSLLFSYTKDNMYFNELYDMAASKMISTNREIGQAVLFSYDYLIFFHLCLASFFNETSSFDQNNPFYLELKKRLQ